MGCLLITMICVISYLIVALAVKIAAMIFGFTFSWIIALGVFAIIWLLKMIF